MYNWKWHYQTELNPEWVAERTKGVNCHIYIYAKQNTSAQLPFHIRLDPLTVVAGSPKDLLKILSNGTWEPRLLLTLITSNMKHKIKVSSTFSISIFSLFKYMVPRKWNITATSVIGLHYKRNACYILSCLLQTYSVTATNIKLSLCVCHSCVIVCQLAVSS